MHDVLAHRISLLSLHAGALEFRPDAPPEEIERAAAVVRASARHALEDLRAVIGVLRDGDRRRGAAAAPADAWPRCPALLEESRAAGMRLSRRRARSRTWPPSRTRSGRHALRIVQEALTNARKHATSRRRSNCVVEGAPGDGLTIEVRNRVAGPGRRRAGDPRRRDRPRRPRRARDALRRPPRARPRRGRRLPAARLAAVAGQ